ncbi:MAG: hypothetical protein WCK67_05075 [bacterium]
MQNTRRCTNPLKLSKAQQKYLQSSNYEVNLDSGGKFERKLLVIGTDPYSGNVLVKETYSGLYNYQKLFILSECGLAEKFKGQKFLNI